MIYTLYLDLDFCSPFLIWYSAILKMFRIFTYFFYYAHLLKQSVISENLVTLQKKKQNTQFGFVITETQQLAD